MLHVNDRMNDVGTVLLLKFEPKYVKTLLRRCKAYEASDQLEDAVGDIDKVVEIDRGNRKFLLEQHRLQSKLKKSKRIRKRNDGQIERIGKYNSGQIWYELRQFQIQPKRRR